MDRHERVARLWIAKDGKYGNTETFIQELAAHLRENYPDEPKGGTCGECRESEAQTGATTHTERGQTMFESVRCKEWGWRFPIACSCPRFEPREDKAARLAREWFTQKWGAPPCEDSTTVSSLADFLRANGVEGD